jgi:hypothetical protein
MITESYPLLASKNNCRFFFESEGIQGKIVKIVLFTPMKDNRWNLGFGDWHKGEVDDLVVSNNQDIVKIMQTVVKAIYLFFEVYPQRIVVFKPVDEKRKKLYNFILKKHINKIEPYFQITGFINENAEFYNSEKFYDYFEIKLKFER